jgi:dTDP-4-amino-4,6-dideoxygalactose transaminase
VIPLIDLKAQHRSVQKELREAFDRVLETSEFALGSEVAAFEVEFANYCGARHGIAVNSGTSALHLALLAAGIGAGDEVITVPFTFVATVAAVIYAGARPIFVDIDPRSYTMDVSQIERAITKRTKAILPVHLYGQPADMDPILEIASRHHLVVIEDAAQAHGAEYKGRRAGSIGDLGCFSFYPTKNLGACGEGGMVVSNRPEYDRTIRMLRDWGQEKKYYPVLKGYNYRMEGLQGAILRVKLRHLEAWTEARRTHAARYGVLLSGSGVQTPQSMAYARHVYHVYAIRTAERAVVQRSLAARGIQSAVHYPYPIHLLPAYSDLGHREGDFPQAEKLSAEQLSLPMYPELSEEAIFQVASIVSGAARDSSKRSEVAPPAKSSMPSS